MSLRTKTLVSIGLLNALLIAIIYGLASQVMLRGFREAETHRNLERMHAIQAALTQRLVDLSGVAGDWATSSPTYDFITSHNPAYLRDNVTDAALREDKLDLALIVDASGHIVYGTSFDSHRNRKVPLSSAIRHYVAQHPVIWKHASPADHVSGVAFIDGKPMMLASRPVLTSEGKGPVAGAVILGRLLDGDEVGIIERLADVSLLRFPWTPTASGPQRRQSPDVELARQALAKPGDVLIRPLPDNPSIIAGYTLLPDFSGGPGLILAAYSPRFIYHQGLVSISYLLASILVYGLAFGIMGLLGLEHWVLGPLYRLSSAVVHIGATQNASERVEVTGNDELGALAAEINVALSSLESYQKQLDYRGLELAAILDHTAVSLVVLDSHLLIQRLNPAMYALAHRDPDAPAEGLSIGEFLGCSVLAAGDCTCGEEAPCADCSVCAALVSTLETGEDHDRLPAMLTLEHDGPRECHLLLSTTRFESGGRTRLLACLEDVTEMRHAERALRESEQRFRELSELLPDMVYEADPTFRFTYANSIAFETLGYTQADLDAGLTLAELIPPEQMSIAQQAIVDTLATGEAVLGQFDIVRKDGTALPCEVHSVAVRNQDGDLLGFRGVLRDISERKQIEESQRLEAVGHLAAGVAHEFNNILAAMRLMAEVARTRGGAADKLIDTVLAGADLGGAICRKLSRFARPASPKREPLLIDAPIEAALSMAAHELDNAGIKVRRDYRHDDTQVYGDAAQLEQVFLNLIINSCHAMPNGGVLSINTSVLPGLHEEVVITVADTGIGIRPDDLQHVFEPFFTTKRESAEAAAAGDRITGTGLGLSVSHRIISAHGGLVSIRSQWGAGTSIEIRLLAYSGPEDDDLGDEDDEAPGDGHESASDVGELPAPAHHILLVEDGPTVRDAMVILLRQAGHRVTTASTTDQALDALREDRFDLVIADLVLKGGGGREVLAATRFMENPPPVVIVTGLNDEAAIGEAMALGAKKCVRKPFSMDEILEAVSEAFPHPHA